MEKVTSTETVVSKLYFFPFHRSLFHECSGLRRLRLICFIAPDAGVAEKHVSGAFLWISPGRATGETVNSVRPTRSVIVGILDLHKRAVVHSFGDQAKFIGFSLIVVFLLFLYQ